jgi:hypothetical protein
MTFGQRTAFFFYRWRWLVAPLAMLIAVLVGGALWSDYRADACVEVDAHNRQLCDPPLRKIGNFFSFRHQFEARP